MNFPSRTSGYLMVGHQGRLAFADRMTVALWVNPSTLGSMPTLVRHPSQYRIDLASSGNVSMTFNTPPLPPGGWTTIGAGSTGALPRNAWSHVVMTFDAGELRASAGLSVLWRSPMGPISISYATPLRKKDDDQVERLQFTFGGVF